MILILMMQVLLIDELAKLLRLSESAIRKLLSDARKGKAHFINPISVRGGKLRFRSCDVESYLASLDTTQPQSKGARQRQRNDKAFAKRQADATAELNRHYRDGKDNDPTQ